MDRTLLEIFDRLAAGREPDVGAALRSAGHGDLSADLLNQSLVSYCDTAPIEVATHLAPHITAITGLTAPDPAIGLGLLAAIPAEVADDLRFGAGGPVEGAIDESAPADQSVIAEGTIDHGTFDSFGADHSWLEHDPLAYQSFDDSPFDDDPFDDDPFDGTVTDELGHA